MFVVSEFLTRKKKKDSGAGNCIATLRLYTMKKSRSFVLSDLR